MKLSTSTLQTITALAVTLLSAACGGGETGVMEPGLITHAINPTEIVPRSAQLLASGEQTYETQCLACHGPEGNGEGEAAYLLYPRPRDFTVGRYRLVSTWDTTPTDEDLFRTISRGMPGSGMPSWAHLSEETRWGLVHYIKRFTTRDFTVKPGSGPPSFGASGTGIIRVPPEPPYTDDARARANELYVMGCAPCHGDTGTGDGPQDQVNSKGYPTRPRDLTAGIANALAAVTGDQRFSDMFKFENEGRRSIYLQRLLDSSTTTSGFKVEDLMAGKHGPPGGALLNFRTYPRVPFYEQVHDDEPFHTDTGRLNAYSDIPEAIEYGENFIVHREGPEATPYLPNVIVTANPYVRPDDYDVPLGAEHWDDRTIRNVKMAWREVKTTRNFLWDRGFQFYCLTPKTRHRVHSGWSNVDWHMPMHQTDPLFHKQKVFMGFLFGGEADSHAINTVPKETLVRITKAEDGGLGGSGKWAPATTGFTPDNENDVMRRYLAGDLTRVRM